MQWLAEICVRRPVFAWVLMLLVIVAGVVGYSQLGLDYFPNVEPPFVVVTTRYDGASPEEVEADVSDELEAAINTIAGIKELRSTSSEGMSQVLIEFDLDVDPDIAAQDVRDKIALIRHTLPEGIEEPVVSKVDFNAAPVLELALRGDMPIRELTRIADVVVRRRIESLDGVGQVDLVGDRERRVHVWLDAIRLRAAGLTAADVHAALATQNTNLPGGALETGPEQISVRVAGRVTDAAQISRLVVREGEGGAIRIEDVARVEDGQAEEESAALLDGLPAVGLAIRKQSGRNSVAVVDAVRARLATIADELPPGVTLHEIRDGSAASRTSVHAVQEHLVLGAVFASLVVLLMLGSTRSTFISALSIPISIIGTFAMMWMFGLTLNVLTLLALALGVGIVIDDAIVVLENIVSFVEKKRHKPFPAAIHATKEIGLAVLATTLSLMAVFVPVAFMPGMMGRFLASFGITMAVAVGVSMIVSFTITPMLAARMLPPPGSPRGKMDVILDRVVSVAYRPLERAYVAALRVVMRYRWAVVVVCALALAAVPTIASRLPSGFLPEDDLGRFGVTVRTPEGTSLAETRLVAMRIAEDVRALPEVEHAYLTIGAGVRREPNLANIYVQLSAPETRALTQAQLMQMARERIATVRSSGLRVGVAEIPMVPVGTSSARVQFAISGPDIDVLARTAEDIMRALRESRRAVDVDQSLIVGKPSLDVAVDRDRAADLGVRASDIATTMRIFVGGVPATSFADDGEDVEVHVRADPRYRRDENALGVLDVPRGREPPSRCAASSPRAARSASRRSSASAGSARSP
ncbi:MAG: efflux RND transporter permease subunit [Sandaracinaceae bacterium]|nr:efflux RND transporter permease subunit [Sandaracinaceae bacterium]